MLEKSDMTNMSASNDFFQKLEAAKDDQIAKYPYEGSTVANRMILDKNVYKYEERCANQLEKFGYSPHVSKSMMFAYCGENSVCNSIHSGTLANEYASMVAHQKMEAAKLKEPTLKIAEDSIKQALCFKVLQDASGVKELNSETVRELHVKAEILSEHLTKENVHALNNKNLMNEARSALNTDNKNVQPLRALNVERIVDVNHGDIEMISAAQNRKTKELEQMLNKDRANDFEISI